MDITDSRIDAGKAFDWGGLLRITQNTGTFIRSSFTKKLWTGDFAWKGSGFWILEPELA